MTGVEVAILKIGLPVTCRKCKVKGFVKPQTNYGGWWRWKLLRGRSTWYCPDHAGNGSAMKKNLETAYKTPDPEQTPEDATAELYKLLD